MSLAGLGLSLGESVHAKIAPGAAPGGAKPLGLQGLNGTVEGDQATSGALALAAIPPGPLDVTLSWPSTPPALSAEDRAAVALAMVLMAEAPPSEPSRVTPDFDASSSAKPPPKFLRGIQDVASASEPATEAPAPIAFADGSPIEPAPAADQRVDLELALAPQGLALDSVDLDLSAWDGADPAAATAAERLAEGGWALDLNLDLSPGLDLNLDLAPEVDLALDRPPVFPVTRLRPFGSAARGERSAALCTADELPVLREVLGAGAAAAVSARAPVAIVAAEPTPVDLAPAPTAEPAPKVALIDPTPKIAPTIVVASHADRVLRSLEVLLSSDGPADAHVRPEAEEIFVTSHAEKVLRTLASTCAGERTAPAADETRPISKVAVPQPVDACRANATMAKAPLRARSSVIGDGAIALNQNALDKVRGGFETSSGLKISFGIERAVYINGALVTTTSLNLSDLGKVTGGAGLAAAAVAGSSNLTLIQNGPGNTFVTGPVSAATVGTIVQNTLNDQKIQSVTAINATVNSLQVVRAQNFQSTLRGALIDSLRR